MEYFIIYYVKYFAIYLNLTFFLNSTENSKHATYFLSIILYKFGIECDENKLKGPKIC